MSDNIFCANNSISKLDFVHLFSSLTRFLFLFSIHRHLRLNVNSTMSIALCSSSVLLKITKEKARGHCLQNKEHIPLANKIEFLKISVY